jgi:hemoglobin
MSLYTDLGADEAIDMALDRFYDKVYADPQIGGYFAKVDRKRLKLHASAFLAMAFGGPNHYEGPGLRVAHAGPRSMGLDESDAGVFLKHFRSTLEELGVPSDKVEQVMDIANGGLDDVLDRP